jgi:hypothetical protein
MFERNYYRHRRIKKRPAATITSSLESIRVGLPGVSVYSTPGTGGVSSLDEKEK